MPNNLFCFFLVIYLCLSRYLFEIVLGFPTLRYVKKVKHIINSIVPTYFKTIDYSDFQFVYAFFEFGKEDYKLNISRICHSVCL